MRKVVEVVDGGALMAHPDVAQFCRPCAKPTYQFRVYRGKNHETYRCGECGGRARWLGVIMLEAAA